MPISSDEVGNLRKRFKIDFLGVLKSFEIFGNLRKCFKTISELQFSANIRKCSETIGKLVDVIGTVREKIGVDLEKFSNVCQLSCCAQVMTGKY